MLSYTSRRNLFGDLTNNKTSANLTLADTLCNVSEKAIIRYFPWPFLITTDTQSTVASQQFYNLPFNFGRLVSVSVTIGSTKYTPKKAPSLKFWNEINSSTSVKSDIPEWYIILNGQLGFYPTPSSATSNAITYTYVRRAKDLSVADYTTGGILTATSGSTLVVGTTTVWTTKMADRWVKITDSNTANAGDGEWYEISSVSSGTTLVLKRNYDGVDISSANAAYTIGQMGALPEEFQELPVYRALWIYFTSSQPNAAKAALYKNLYQEGLMEMKSEYSDLNTDPSIEDGGIDTINPNLFVQL